MVGSDVFIILHHLVDDAVRGQLDDTVCHCLDELVVVRREQDVSFIGLQVIVECLDGFQVKVVGRRIQNETVGITQLHTRNHATHLLATRQYACFLQHLFAGEKHTAEETLHIYLIALAKLAQPVNQIQIRIKESGVVQRQISGGNRNTPVESSRIRLHISVDNLEQSGHGTRIV